MSTRSTIAIKRKDGTTTAIYCHYDGYIEGVGTTLQLAYNTAEKVEELLKLGDLSQLMYNTEPTDETHSFDMPQNGICVAYHRDRGEAFRQSNRRNEFNYTFDEEESVWYVEKETFERDTEAMEFLGINCVISYPRSLLLDEILKCDFTHWQPDEYAKTGAEARRVCIEKAFEAREKIIEEQRAEHEAYYRAYCD